MISAPLRTWHVQLKSGISWPFFATTRRDYTEDELHDMMPRCGIGGLMVPVIGEIPEDLKDTVRVVRERSFVQILQSDVVKMWYIDDLLPAQQLRLYDTIQASTVEGM